MFTFAIFLKSKLERESSTLNGAPPLLQASPSWCLHTHPPRTPLKLPKPSQPPPLPLWLAHNHTLSPINFVFEETLFLKTLMHVLTHLNLLPCFPWAFYSNPRAFLTTQTIKRTSTSLGRDLSTKPSRRGKWRRRRREGRGNLATYPRATQANFFYTNRLKVKGFSLKCFYFS